MNRIILLIAALLSFFLMEGQQTVDFEHRSMLKKLRKYDCSKELQFQKLYVPETIEITEENSAYFFVDDPECHFEATFVFVGRVNTCCTDGCSVFYGDSKGRYFEYFDYFIVFNGKGDVTEVKVFSYEATHGQEITSKRWLKQFKNYNGQKDIQVGKDIDGITGATTSVHSISFDVQERTRRMKRILAFYNGFLSGF